MIEIRRHSGVYTLKSVQHLPITIEEAWQYFSNPNNLAKITPPSMRFEITSEMGSKQIYAGQIITYRVTPIAGFRTNWVTEITQVKEKEYFIDEQRFGPYSMWHHLHRFEPNGKGVTMTDEVTYKIPFYAIGNFIHWLIIKRKLINLFSYRSEKLVTLFGVQKS